MNGLGQDVVQLDLDETPFWEIGDTLLAVRAGLDEMQAGIRESAAVAVAIGPELTRLEAQYGDAVAQYQRIRVAVGMSPAPGLGAWWVVPAWVVGGIALAAALVAAVAAAVSALKQKFNDAKVIDNARARQEAGDPQGAAAWLDLLKESTAGLEAWLGKNWVVVALALGGVVVVTSGKGRR